jgi:hypothetical protein
MAIATPTKDIRIPTICNAENLSCLEAPANRTVQAGMLANMSDEFDAVVYRKPTVNSA